MNRLPFALACIIASACGSDGSQTDPTTTLELSFSGLGELGSGYVYEGWMITSTGPVSTGRFTVDATGALTPNTSIVDATQLADSAKFVLTIEPVTGDVPEPSAVHVLAGPISANSATLSTDDPAALGTNFSTAAGKFILRTPTTMANTADDNQGIWWVVPPAPDAGLTLPTLPNGWMYEGWVVGSAGPVSTGRFLKAAEADSDKAGAAKGPDASGPPFPGQDFIDPAMDLVGLKTVISVEPEPDDSAKPFAIKPLVLGTIADVALPATQDMSNNAAASIPSGTAAFTTN